MSIAFEVRFSGSGVSKCQFLEKPEVTKYQADDGLGIARDV